MEKVISINSVYDSVPLYATLSYNEHSTKGLIQIMHGMAEHRARYQYFVNRLLEHGYAVLNCDERGHGQSAIIQGYFAKEDGWVINVEDLYQLTLLAKQECDLPVILFGHSMGTLVARSYLKRHEEIVSKVILSGTPNNNKMAGVAIGLCKLIIAMKGKEYRSKLLDKLSFGAFNKDIANPKTAFDWLSTNEENVQAYLNDADCGFIFTAQGFYDLLWGMKDVYQSTDWDVKKPYLPIQFYSGANDPCMGKEAGMKEAVTILHECGYENVGYTLFPRLRHEILNETERDQVIDAMLEFLG